MNALTTLISAVRRRATTLQSNNHDLYGQWRMWRPRALVLRPLAEVWNHLPVYYYLYVIVLMVLGDLTLFPEPRREYLPSALFPLAVVLASHWGRVSFEERDGVRRLFRMAVFSSFVCALVVGAVLLGEAIGFRRLGPPLAHLDAVKYEYELAGFVTVPLVALHCLWRKGGWGFGIFYFSAFLYGMILESSGVSLGYFHQPCYHFYVPPFSAAAVTMFGWSTVFYPAVCHFTYIREGFAWLRRPGFWIPAVGVTVIAIFIDMVVDPFASNIGLWVWNDLYSPETDIHIFDVPLLNFVAWYAAVIAFGLFYFKLTQDYAGWSVKKTFVWMTALVPAIYLVSGTIQMPTMVLVFEGFDGPTWTIFTDNLKGQRHTFTDASTGEELCAPHWIYEAEKTQAW